MKLMLVVIGVVSMLLLASCGGGASAVNGLDNPALTGVVEGYITEADQARAASAAGDGVGGADVWCENGTGEMLRQGQTDATGHYRLDGLPVDCELLLRFRYQARLGDGTGDTVVEGEQPIRLQARQQLRVDAGVCENDANGDGASDAVECDNSQMQVRLRQRDGAGGQAQGSNGNGAEDNGSGSESGGNGNGDNSGGTNGGGRTNGGGNGSNGGGGGA